MQRVWENVKWMIIVILSLLLYAFLSKLAGFHFTSVFNGHHQRGWSLVRVIHGQPFKQAFNCIVLEQENMYVLHVMMSIIKLEIHCF